MKVFHKIRNLSLPKTLALWGGAITLYGLAYFGLSATGHSVLVHGTSITTSVSGFFDALYYSALHGFSFGFAHAGSSPAVGILAKTQLAVSAGFFTLFVHKAAKSAAASQQLQYQSVHEYLNKIISKLYIYRYDVGKLIEKVEQGLLSRHHMKDFWITASGIDTALVDLHEVAVNHLAKEHRNASEEAALKRALSALDAAFYSTVYLFSQCSKNHIKWNYQATIQSLANNMILVDDIIQTLAQEPIERETLYQLAELQKIFGKLNELIREKEDLGFSDLADLGEIAFEEALEHELEIKVK